MNGYNFTERVRTVLRFAREEAANLGHEYVGDEHILLGLIREGAGVGIAVLEHFDIDRDAVRENVLKVVATGRTPQPPGMDVPYTSRAKKALE